jgi:nucleoside diphosphate kinase
VIELLIEFLHHHYPELNDTAFYAQIFVIMVLVPRNQVIVQGKKGISRAGSLVSQVALEYNKFKILTSQ